MIAVAVGNKISKTEFIPPAANSHLHIYSYIQSL